MGLKDLNDALYKRDGIDRKEDRSHQFDPATNKEESEVYQEKFQVHNEWNAPQESFAERNRKAIRQGAIACGAILFVAITYFAIVQIQRSSFSSDRVTVAVDGPRDVSGSESSLFVFTYTNNNRTDLTDVDLNVTYPENFRPDPLENMSVNGASSTVHILKIAGHSKGKVELRGKFYGSKGTLAYIKGVLRYKPESVGSFFQAESQLGITIQSPSIKLSIEAPLEVSSGGTVEYRLDYTNMSDVSFDRLRVKTEYPEGFHLVEANPKTAEGDNIWYVGNLLPGKTGSISIVGTVDGVRNEAKILKAHIGMLQGNGELLSYSDSDRLTKIVASPLSIKQTVNGLDKANVSPGSALRYDINFRNEGEIGLRNVIVSVALEGSALDFSRLDIGGGGAFDDKRHIITWKASDVHDLANLAPGKSGSVSLYIPVFDTIPASTDADKNFLITSVARIDSPDIATPTGSNKIIGSNTMRVKVNSRVAIKSIALYEDAALSNSGPVPPAVGQETTYTVHWSLSNTTNDIDQAVATAYLPTGVRFTGKVLPSSENLVYNERTNQLTWNLGSVQNGTGTIRPKREVLFQVGITPQINQIAQNVALIEDTLFTAHDTFTNETLSSNDRRQTVVTAP